VRPQGRAAGQAGAIAVGLLRATEGAALRVPGETAEVRPAQTELPRAATR
jgi:hypothetical protein